MRTYRKIFIMVMLVALCAAMAIPVSAARPVNSSVGILEITTDTNSQPYLAVCVAEDDGNYVYSGSHPIQKQTVAYITLTNTSDFNSLYAVEEDTEYDGAQGIYRFALGERLESGSEADVYPEMAATAKK